MGSVVYTSFFNPRTKRTYWSGGVLSSELSLNTPAASLPTPTLQSGDGVPGSAHSCPNPNSTAIPSGLAIRHSGFSNKARP